MTMLACIRHGNHRLAGSRNPLLVLALWVGLCCLSSGTALAQTAPCDPTHAGAQGVAANSAVPALFDTESQNQEKVTITRDLVLRFRLKRTLATRIVDAVYREAQSRGLPPPLVLAIIAAESGFDPAATSAAGACGLMQVLPRYHQQLVKQLAPGADLYFPESNIRIGTTILQRYLAVSAGDLDAALTSYSGGSRGYAARVHTRWQEFTSLIGMPTPERPVMLLSELH